MVYLTSGISVRLGHDNKFTKFTAKLRCQCFVIFVFYKNVGVICKENTVCFIQRAF